MDTPEPFLKALFQSPYYRIIPESGTDV
jgi:hypothetical protein